MVPRRERGFCPSLALRMDVMAAEVPVFAGMGLKGVLY